MENRVITISGNGAVNVPTKVEMTDFEIADLLGVMVPTVKGCIKRLLKSRMALYCSGAEVSGNKIIPTHFGLDVVIAVAFQVESHEAAIFCKWAVRRLTRPTQPPIYLSVKEREGVIN